METARRDYGQMRRGQVLQMVASHPKVVSFPVPSPLKRQFQQAKKPEKDKTERSVTKSFCWLAGVLPKSLRRASALAAFGRACVGRHRSHPIHHGRPARPHPHRRTHARPHGAEPAEHPATTRACIDCPDAAPRPASVRTYRPPQALTPRAHPTASTPTRAVSDTLSARLPRQREAETL